MANAVAMPTQEEVLVQEAVSGTARGLRLLGYEFEAGMLLAEGDPKSSLREIRLEEHPFAHFLVTNCLIVVEQAERVPTLSGQAKREAAALVIAADLAIQTALDCLSQ